MYYSVLIEVTEGTGKNSKTKQYTLLNQPSKDRIIAEVVSPYCKGDDFLIDGYIVNKSKISRLKIVSSELSVNAIVEIKQKSIPPNVICIITKESVISSAPNRYLQDITNDVLSDYDNKKESNNKKVKDIIRVNNNKVFIVHGHDDAIKYDVSNFLRKVGLEPIILHEQANQGKTIIEKIEKECADVGYGIVLYTPCDKGGTAEMSPNDMQYRARQNVVFEHGYLIGKLGRKKVCALVEGDIEKPSDIDGVLYIPYQAGMWELAVGKELRSAGYDIDLNKL